MATSLTPTEQQALLERLGFVPGRTYAVEPDDSIEELEGEDVELTNNERINRCQLKT